MYTSQPCGAPSGATPVPTALVAAATAAATSTIASGGTVQDAMTAVQSAITTFFQANPAQAMNPTGAASPLANQANATAYATQIAYNAACKGAARTGGCRTRRPDLTGSWKDAPPISQAHASRLQNSITRSSAAAQASDGKAFLRAQSESPTRVVPVDTQFSYAPAPLPPYHQSSGGRACDLSVRNSRGRLRNRKRLRGYPQRVCSFNSGDHGSTARVRNAGYPWGT